MPLGIKFTGPSDGTVVVVGVEVVPIVTVQLKVKGAVPVEVALKITELSPGVVVWL